MSGIPGYWPNETSGVLVPVIKHYLEGEELSPAEAKIMVTYLRQWMNKGVWFGVEHLRRALDTVETTADIREWLRKAEKAGIDPL